MGWWSDLTDDGTRPATAAENRTMAAKRKSMNPAAWRRYEHEQHRLFLASRAAYLKAKRRQTR